MQVLIQPCAGLDAQLHYRDTVVQAVDLSHYSTELATDIPALRAIYPDLMARVWGVVSGKNNVNAKKLERARVGDLTVFGGNKKYFAVATLTFVTSAPEFAQKLWSTDGSGNTWEHVYFLDEFREIDIPYSIFNSLVGYQPNYVPMGFNVLHMDSSSNLVDFLGSDSQKHVPDVKETEYEDAINKLLGKGATDKQVKSHSRTEQAFLRRRLFPSLEQTCAICQKTYPREFMVAAHIKRRSACTESERLDWRNIVMPVCRFGCDELYERGFVSTDNHGQFVVTSSSGNGEVNAFLGALSGSPCPYFRAETEEYFRWHREEKFLV